MDIKLYDERYIEISLIGENIENFERDKDNIGRLSVLYGNKDISENCKVILNLNKQAILGFGINLIRAANNYYENNHYHVEPLGTIISNQAMGFFLTPESSSLVLGCKSHGLLTDFEEKSLSKKHEIKSETDRFGVKYLVDLQFDNDYFEPYNLGFNNVGELKVYRDGLDISMKCEVVLTLSKSAMIGLGTKLIRFINKYGLDSEENLNSLELHKYSLGVFIRPTSCDFSIKYKLFNKVFFYDGDFGIR